ncbi:hypothetical protein BHE74_00047668 [Ensete ventricosum]|nr:hypothetical protein GW17_00037149 [Ensete ventricosum]RWW46402.1 hypothetical protein BHE74_00047668 [Ensete ventricosum]RZR95604.1 hypothetical protein BHM03_00024457 [Ensete ventricosum]
MDNLLNSFISSPTWSDGDVSSKASWNNTSISHTNGLLADSVESYGEVKNPSVCRVSSSNIVGNAAAEDLNMHRHDRTSSILLDGKINYGILKDLYSGERLYHQILHCQNSNPVSLDNETQFTTFSLEGVTDSNPTSASFESALPHTTLAISSSIESNSSELSAFPQSLADAHSINSVPIVWPSSYSSVSSFMGHGNLPAFGYQGHENHDDILGKISLENGKFRDVKLRREKIAERMKNLQELVPSSNKGSNSLLLLSSSVGQVGSDISESEDSLAFEKEVVKLMETNVTTAMQYLQHKGLCLMPVALATAISTQKGSSTATPPD